MKEMQKFEVKGKELIISNSELISKGCRNCVWKSNRQCPHHYESEQSAPEGYCMDYFTFILGLAEPNDSINAVWEKFNIYYAELQSLEDYKKYKKLENEIEAAEKDGTLSGKKIAELQLKKESLKFWWHKMNEMVTKSRGRITDREQKSEVNITVDHKISLTQIHQLANKARKQLEIKE